MQNFKQLPMHTAAVATAAGTVMYPTTTEGAFSSFTAQVQGVSGDTVTWEGTLDGTNWKGFLMAPTTTGTGALTATADGIYRGTVQGFMQVRARLTWSAGNVTITGVLSSN